MWQNLIVISTAFAIYVVGSLILGAAPFWFIGGPRIWLTDCQGGVKVTRKRVDRNGVAWAYVYPSSKVGHVILLPGGGVDGESSYIDSWSSSKPKDREIEQRNARFVGLRPNGRS